MVPKVLHWKLIVPWMLTNWNLNKNLKKKIGKAQLPGACRRLVFTLQRVLWAPQRQPLAHQPPLAARRQAPTYDTPVNLPTISGNSRIFFSQIRFPALVWRWGEGSQMCSFLGYK